MTPARHKFWPFLKNHALAERAFSQPPCQRPLDMGCGFSTEDTKASDEERILKASDGVTGKAETTVQVILFEIDCTIFYTNLHELFCQFIS